MLFDSRNVDCWDDGTMPFGCLRLSYGRTRVQIRRCWGDKLNIVTICCIVYEQTDDKECSEFTGTSHVVIRISMWSQRTGSYAILSPQVRLRTYYSRLFIGLRLKWKNMRLFSNKTQLIIMKKRSMGLITNYLLTTRGTCVCISVLYSPCGWP